VVGPDIMPSGRILTPTEMGNNFFGDLYLEADSPMEFRKAVRVQYQAGAQFIKIMGTGAVMNPGGTPGAAIIMEDELQAACDAAKFLNLHVAVHCHGTDAIKMCVRCGVRTVEHSSIMDEECIQMYLNTTESYPMLTLAPLTNFIEFPEGRPEHYVSKAKAMRDIQIEGAKAVYAAGVKIGWGTDAGVYEGSHGDGIYEFRARVRDAGYSPLDCLIQATKNNAEILMIDDKVGTLEVGKKANILAVKGNPDEDIEKLTNVELVLKAGKKVIL
ncbi:MAG: amidohydrolase family protein, partial [Eubacteriales bacterium]